MYVQITTVCNMKCDHCAFSCTRKGTHMDDYVFYKSLEFIENHEGDETIAIGGGEPTCHPNFINLLKKSSENFDHVWFATNGKKTRTMRQIINFVLNNPKDNVFVELSLDYYHEPINLDIQDFFERNDQHKESHFHIRNVSEHVKAVGRALKTGVYREHGCACPGIFIDPTGNLHPCGCTNAPVIGNVHSGILDQYTKYINSDEYKDTECWNNKLED